MKQVNDDTLNAQLSLDEDKRVRQINYLESPWRSDQNSPVMAALDYLRQMGYVIGVSEPELNSALEKVSFFDPKEQGLQYRFGGEKQLFDSSTIIFNQTYLNVPVWRAAITLTVKQNPNQIISVIDTSEHGIDASLPSPDKIEAHRRMFALAATDQHLKELGLGNVVHSASFAESGSPETSTASFIRNILGRDLPAAMAEDESVPDDSARAIRGRFFVYRYYESERITYGRKEVFPESEDETESPAINSENREDLPVLSLPNVDPSIENGAWRVVSEVTFQLKTPELGVLNWRALVDVETDSILFLEPLVAGNFGLIFQRDPITSSGNTSNRPDRDNSVLNTHRTAMELPNLKAPVEGRQFLTGRFVTVVNVEQPNIDPPNVVAGSRFEFDVRTNDFAAVNAYYHADRFFALVENLGFPISSYFSHTTFPVRIDHRDNVDGNGNAINARCMGDGTSGTRFAGYCLNDLTDTANPIGRACDSRVHLHELGGHGILYEHVGHANFGFAHSAGDSLSAILHDPDSALRSDPSLRFKYAPWHPTLDRRFDRDVTQGWAWGGPSNLDNKGYGSEQILCTTLFRVYQSIGGDSSDLNQRRFASRMMIYFILRTVSTLTPATNPDNALSFANAMMSVDLLNWTTEGIFGGAYNKVIRWSFEKQGLFQPAGAPSPARQAGAPPDVDVFIDDGRRGEYEYQPMYSNNGSIWNRRIADGGSAHQEPISGVTNFAYVRVKNRGTQVAQNVLVRGFHHKTGGTTIWPTDFQSLNTPELTVGSLGPRGQEEKVVGPFAWVPVEDGLGHDSLMMVVSATGDSSNIDNFMAGETIAEWRLVPNDNNIGLRNVVPGSLEDAPFESSKQMNELKSLPINDLQANLRLSSQDIKTARVKSLTFQIEMNDEIPDEMSSGAEEKNANTSELNILSITSKNIGRSSSSTGTPAQFKWGMVRHAAIASAAWQRLTSQKARQEILRIFENSNLEPDLGEAARWADQLKTSDRPTDPATERFLGDHRNRRHDTWHYVNLPRDLQGYDRQQFPQFTRSEDIVQSILLCIQSLRLPGPLARFEEINALRWLTHLIGDLHQPVHIGCGYIANARTNQARLVFTDNEAVGLESDRGGGALLLPIGGNLHGFWDSKLGPDMIPHPLDSESEITLVSALVDASENGEFPKETTYPSLIANWANESLEAAKFAYPHDLRIISHNPSGSKDLYEVEWEGEGSYVNRCAPIVSKRMTAAARNLAGLLDKIWS